MSHKRIYDLQIRGKLRDGTACVYRIQYTARIREVLEKIQGSPCDPWSDLLEILRRVELSDHCGTEFIGDGPTF